MVTGGGGDDAVVNTGSNVAAIQAADFGSFTNRGSNIETIDLSGADFTGCKIARADFSGANLSDCRFDGASGLELVIVSDDTINADVLKRGGC